MPCYAEPWREGASAGRLTWGLHLGEDAATRNISLHMYVDGLCGGRHPRAAYRAFSTDR